MAKDVLITPASSIIEFKDNAVKVGSIYELNGNLYLDVSGGSIFMNGAVTLGDGTPANIEIGASGTFVNIDFLGGGSLTSSGNALNLGLAGDTINLNVPSVTYNFPSTLVTTADFTDSALLSKIKAVDGAGSGLDADLLDGYHADELKHDVWPRVFMMMGG